MDDFPIYPSGLRLTGRRVVVVGGGHVAQRRVPQLIAVGADVHVVSPEITPAIEGMVGGGELTWHARGFEDGDLDGTWYVIAATDDREVNEQVSVVAESRRIFCVRSDDATRATAWTPAVGRHAGVTVAVLGQREPQRSAAVRDEIVEGLREGTIVARHQRDRAAGVVLVGGGPGDPELISVAGRKALMEADVVVADRLAPRELLGELPADVELIDVAKLPRGRSAQQEEINRVIVDRALAGKRVVRFKGGDSFVFGRGYEEVLACREAGVPVTVIPGLSSSVSVPAVAGIPVTHRGITHEFTVVSGHLPPDHPESLVNWAAIGQLSGTVVLMMAVENAPAIATALVDGGRPATTPVAVVSDGTMPGERTVLATLGTLADELLAHDVRPPAIIVVGEVVALAHPAVFGGRAAGEGRPGGAGTSGGRAAGEGPTGGAGTSGGRVAGEGRTGGAGSSGGRVAGEGRTGVSRP
jgi:uroporphyrin-III C-methyltransferase / precorrin-2 dehydrogenase / sirohydrochlorin ferrochelatase